jgi:hypothetical protein
MESKMPLVKREWFYEWVRTDDKRWQKFNASAQDEAELMSLFQRDADQKVLDEDSEAWEVERQASATHRNALEIEINELKEKLAAARKEWAEKEAGWLEKWVNWNYANLRFGNIKLTDFFAHIAALRECK